MKSVLSFLLMVAAAFLLLAPAGAQSSSEWRKMGDRSFAAGQIDQACTEYAKAVDHGDEIAALKMGWVLYDQKRSFPDAGNLFTMTLLMAEKGYPDAQMFLGYFYDKGIGTASNPSEAVRWYRQAALRSVAAAQYELAMLYAGGRGVEQNSQDAMQWICKASTLGFVPAMKKLAEMQNSVSWIATGQELIPETVRVEGGLFMMGRNSAEKSEAPAHEVEVSTFHMGIYEVTNAQFCAFLNDWGSKISSLDHWIDLNGQTGRETCRIYHDGTQFKVESCYANHPALFVAWEGALAYALWLGEKTGEAWRLPTEAEWEFAARAGRDSLLFSGSDNIEEVGWVWSNSNYMAHEVGSSMPNKLGIYDMTGNAWEWCMDYYRRNYYQRLERNNPTGPRMGVFKVLRGGGWDSFVGISHVWARHFLIDPLRLGTVGFRVVKQETPFDEKTLRRYEWWSKVRVR